MYELTFEKSKSILACSDLFHLMMVALDILPYLLIFLLLHSYNAKGNWIWLVTALLFIDLVCNFRKHTVM